MMEAKMMIAGSFDEFVEKITQAERKALNTPFGQEITERLLKMKPSEKPVRLLPVAAIKTSWTQSLQLKAGLSTHIKQYNAVFAP